MSLQEAQQISTYMIQWWSAWLSDYRTKLKSLQYYDFNIVLHNHTYVQHCSNSSNIKEIKTVRRSSAIQNKTPYWGYWTKLLIFSLQVDYLTRSTYQLYSTGLLGLRQSAHDVQLVSRPRPTTQSRSRVNAHVIQRQVSITL